MVSHQLTVKSSGVAVIVNIAATRDVTDNFNHQLVLNIYNGGELMVKTDNSKDVDSIDFKSTTHHYKYKRSRKKVFVLW